MNFFCFDRRRLMWRSRRADGDFLCAKALRSLELLAARRSLLLVSRPRAAISRIAHAPSSIFSASSSDFSSSSRDTRTIERAAAVAANGASCRLYERRAAAAATATAAATTPSGDGGGDGGGSGGGDESLDRQADEAKARSQRICKRLDARKKRCSIVQLATQTSAARLRAQALIKTPKSSEQSALLLKRRTNCNRHATRSQQIQNSAHTKKLCIATPMSVVTKFARVQEHAGRRLRSGARWRPRKRARKRAKIAREEVAAFFLRTSLFLVHVKCARGNEDARARERSQNDVPLCLGVTKNIEPTQSNDEKSDSDDRRTTKNKIKIALQTKPT